MSSTSGGVVRGAATARALRVRDVVPAALTVVLLLGMAGCMGAFGGGPLDDALGSVSVRELVPAGSSHEPTVRGVGTVPEGLGMGEGLDGAAERLADLKRTGATPAVVSARGDVFACGDLVRLDGPGDCLADLREAAVGP